MIQNRKTKHTRMKRKYFYPSDSSDQPDWHLNFAAKVAFYGALLGMTEAEIKAAVADNLYMAYALGEWINNVREYAPACTSILETLARGTGPEPFVFPAYVPPPLPTLPVGVTEVLPGALDRTLRLAKRLKTADAYTESIGLDMGIVGSELPPPPPPGEVPVPVITVMAISGTANQNGRVKFVKNGHEYVIIECRTNGGAYVDLGMANKSPFIDSRPLLVPGVAEIREYRARYYDNSAPSSDWCGPEKVTISP